MIDKKDMAIVMALGLLLSVGLAMSQGTEQIKQEAIASDQASQEDTEELKQEVIANEQEAQVAMEDLKQEVIAGAQAPQETEQGTAKDSKDGNVTASSLQGVFWTLESLLNSEGEMVSVLPNTEVTTLFQDGRVSGNAGCNSYAADYESIGYNLTIGPIMLRRAEDRLAREQEQYSQRKLDTVVSVGSSVLGAIFGGRRGAASRAGTAARSAGRVFGEKNDVDRASAGVEGLRTRLAELEREVEKAVAAVTASHDAGTASLEGFEVAPRKADITVDRLQLAWEPWRRNAQGTEEPAWQA